MSHKLNIEVRLGAKFFDVLDFTKGKFDCANGNCAKLDENENYYNGYGQQYALEAIADREVNHDEA